MPFRIALMDTGITMETAEKHVNYDDYVTSRCNVRRATPRKCGQSSRADTRHQLRRDVRGHSWLVLSVGGPLESRSGHIADLKNGACGLFSLVLGISGHRHPQINHDIPKGV